MAKGDRGEVWIVDLGMAGKVRPCLVVSVPTEPEDRILVTLVPHTTSVHGTRFEVDIRARFLRVAGVFDAQQILTVPHVKLIRKIGTLSADQMEPIEKAIRVWLSL